MNPSKWLRDNWNAIVHNVIAGLLTAGVAAALLMLWSYIQGHTGPWIVALGIFSIAATLWLRRELLSSRVASGASQQLAGNRIAELVLSHAENAPAQYDKNLYSAWTAEGEMLLEALVGDTEEMRKFRSLSPGHWSDREVNMERLRECVAIMRLVVARLPPKSN